MSVLADFCVGVLVMVGWFGLLMIGWLIGSECKLRYRRRRYDRSGHKRGSR